MATTIRKPGDLPSIIETHATGRRAWWRYKMSVVSELTIDGAQLNASLSAVDTEVNEPVQIKLLAWVMGLPAGLDPAVAAQLVMRHQSIEEARENVTQHTVSRALMRLVEVVAQYPHERLMALTSQRRKRAVH